MKRPRGNAFFAINLNNVAREIGINDKTCSSLSMGSGLSGAISSVSGFASVMAGSVLQWEPKMRNPWSKTLPLGLDLDDFRVD
jgi:hypothetical protein